MFCGGRKKYVSIVLRSLAKPVEFGETLPVYFTACSGYSSCVHNEFCFELGLNKVIVIQSVLVQDTVLGLSKMLNVAY